MLLLQVTNVKKPNFFRSPGLTEMWRKITNWVQDPKTQPVENILRTVKSNLFDFLSEEPAHQNSTARQKREEQAMTSNLTARQKREEQAMISKRGIIKNVNIEMIEQSLLASAIFLEFWSQSFETSSKVECYTIQLCKIKQSLERIGPWAKLTGRSLMQGLTKFAPNDNIWNAVQQFEEEEKVDSICKNLSVNDSC